MFSPLLFCGVFVDYQKSKRVEQKNYKTINNKTNLNLNAS